MTGTGRVSMVWLEPHRVHAGGQERLLPGPASDPALDAALGDLLQALPPGATRWVVDDAWIPSLLLRDIVEIPSGAEAREAFFRWRFQQTLALETPQSVHALALGESAWLLAGMDASLRDRWIHASLALGRPLRSLLPRWLWLYNRLAPSREMPGMLLSLRQDPGGEFSGTLAAWGRHLALLRQWKEPASPEAWMQERVLPSAAYLQRDAHAPHELLVWGAAAWPESPFPIRILPSEIPLQEAS